MFNQTITLWSKSLTDGEASYTKTVIDGVYIVNDAKVNIYDNRLTIGDAIQVVIPDNITVHIKNDDRFIIGTTDENLEDIDPYTVLGINDRRYKSELGHRVVLGG